jgi:hypothetical protein
MVLDTIFQNLECDDDSRRKILSKLKLEDNQSDFLLKVFDIDYIYIFDNKPVLIEEKTKNVEGKEFRSSNYIYFDHGTSTQNKNLTEAYRLGIESGIMIRCIKYKQTPQGFLGYALPDLYNIQYEESKFYPITNCEYMPKSNRTRIKVDDFIKRMRTL